MELSTLIAIVIAELILLWQQKREAAKPKQAMPITMIQSGKLFSVGFRRGFFGEGDQQ